MRLAEPLREPLRPHDVDAARHEGPTDERPPRVDEAQRTRYGDVGQGLAHDGDLTQDAVDEPRAVATSDDELLDPRPEEPALDAQGGGLAAVALRVHDPHPARCHDDVVDVRARPRDESVVKHLDRPIGGELVEARAEPLFPDGASIPRRGALLLLGEGDRDSAEPSPLRTQPLLVTSPTASVKGTDRLGKKLRATANGWSVPDVTTSYQWLRNGKAIKGATKRTYTLKKADVGKRVVVRVTGSKAGHDDGASSSKAAKLKASAKGRVTVRLPRLARGAYRIKVTYTPSAKSKKHVTKASSKRVTLRVR